VTARKQAARLGIIGINVIPSAAVERIKIISGGASATYGVDAAAGLTNFILKKNLQGAGAQWADGQIWRPEFHHFERHEPEGSAEQRECAEQSLCRSDPLRPERQPDHPQFSSIYADQFACAAAGGTGGCANNELFGQVPTAVQTLLNNRHRRAVRGDAQFNPALPVSEQPLISAANDPLTLYYNFPESRDATTVSSPCGGAADGRRSQHAGDLFELPAGELRFAAGASYRELRFRFINDTLNRGGVSFLDQAIGVNPTEDVGAGYRVKEVYGELLAPVIGDLPFVDAFSLELGGRMSSYSTTGASWTYKLLGDREVTDWLRSRGDYNRAELAPNAAELFLAPSQGLSLNPSGDICSERALRSVSADPNAATRPRCARRTSAPFARS